MLNIIGAAAWSSNGLWKLFSAQRAVDEAIIALEDAGAALLPLVDASEWQADGVRALHVLIVDLKERTTAEVGVVRSRSCEIDAAGRS
ncbi:hypothetical protein [Microbacterium sp. TWP3-1-2b2]|uniref:hypothetical protein n=1 Tax=Microbacterium sp. TWP3-1-2b2 TaxID=2804651 RepID=UPI003CF42E61